MRLHMNLRMNRHFVSQCSCEQIPFHHHDAKNRGTINDTTVCRHKNSFVLI